jgi:hypothetical protein
VWRRSTRRKPENVGLVSQLSERFRFAYGYVFVEHINQSSNNKVIPMKDVFKLVVKSKWTYVILLALAGLISGGAYSEQLVQMILTLLGQ